MGMDLNTNNHLLFYPLVCYNLNPVPLFETQSCMPCLAAVLHLSPVTTINIVSDHKHAFNSIYQTWHITPYIPPSAASMAEKGGRVVRKLWSRLDGLGCGFGVRWSIENREGGIEKKMSLYRHGPERQYPVCDWEDEFVPSWSRVTVFCLWTIEKRGPLKEREPYVALISQGVLNKWDCTIKGFRLYIPFRQNRNTSCLTTEKQVAI